MIRDLRELLFAQSRDHGGKYLGGRVAECPGTGRLYGVVFTIEEGHERVRAQGEFAGGIVSHSIFLSRVITNRWGDGGIAVDDGSYAEEVCDDRVDGGSLLKCPRDRGGVVATCDRGVPGPIWTY